MNHLTASHEEGLGARYGTAFSLGEHSARHLRRILRLYLTAWEMDDLYDSASLALTELIANVVRHCPDRCATVLILRLPEGRGVRAEVTDASPRPPLSTAVDELSELSEGGRGVGIVDAVTDRWGWVALTGRPGKTVWFECDAKAVSQREVDGERRERNGCRRHDEHPPETPRTIDRPVQNMPPINSARSSLGLVPPDSRQNEPSEPSEPLEHPTCRRQPSPAVGPVSPGPPSSWAAPPL